MAKKKSRVLWQHRFNLSSDNPDHVRLHEQLSKLAEDEKASPWIIETLVQALVLEYSGGTVIVDDPQNSGWKPLAPLIDALKPKPEPHYEPDDEFAGMTPDEKIRARKDKARAKFGK